jgi:transcriptional antiterminator RfaH
MKVAQGEPKTPLGRNPHYLMPNDTELCLLKSGGISVGSFALHELIMTHSREQLALSTSPLWFCLRTQPKHEHIAAMTLRRQVQVPCFAPRLRFKKATRRGAIWFVESMFPGYLFAEFIYPLLHRRVEHAAGIQGIVHFGDQLATVDAETITALRKKAGQDEIVTVDPEINVGQTVRIAEGPFRGLEAVVTRLMPAKERVRVLMEFVGRSVETEVATPKVLPLERRF